MKLELKHLVPYLPYDLKCEILDYQCDYVGDKYDTIKGYYMIGDGIYYNFKRGRDHAGKNTNNFKPILRPLSDLTKEVEINGKKFVPIARILNQFSNEYSYYFNDGVYSQLKSDSDTILLFINNKIAPECNYGISTILFKWHFDVFGLIEKGLAIDINTL